MRRTGRCSRRSTRSRRTAAERPFVLIQSLIDETPLRVERLARRYARRDKSPPMKHVIGALAELMRRFAEPIEALETGTIRSYDEEHESTRHISETLGDRGRLTSVDISSDAIEVSKDICRHAPNVEWVESDSRTYLRSVRDRQFHFALLDSVNDRDFIFEEFRLLVPLMHAGGIIVVDDAGLTRLLTRPDTDGDAEKGRRVWEFLRACSAKYKVLETPRGHGTQLRIDLDPTNLSRIRHALDDEPSRERAGA